MTKMSTTIIFILQLYVSISEARIWFVGDQMPGTNRTITEEPLLSTTTSWAPSTPVHRIEMDHLEKIIGRGITRMSLSLERVIGNEIQNLVFAPVSVAAALSVLLLGANGKTNAEITDFLGLLAGIDKTQIIHTHLGNYFTKFEKNPKVEFGSQLAFANGIFIQNGFSIKPKFDEMAREVYRCEVLTLDFVKYSEAARLFVNRWVENRTDGRIKEILTDSLNPMTSLIIANAFYFNGQWEYPFYGKTRMGAFHVSKTETIQMPLMASAAEIPYYYTREYSILGMPYKGGDLMMYMVLPQKDLNKFVSDLTVETIETMISKATVQTVLYVVPRMKMETTLNLRKPLEDLGVHTLFDSNTSDLSGIAEGVYVSTFYHKVEIQITETGTIASAGTASGLTRGGMAVFRVDRPFLFFIYHKPTNTIIFWGSIYKPTPYLET